MTWDTDLKHWRKVIEINTIGLFICNKHELKQMLKQDSIEVFVPIVQLAAALRLLNAVTNHQLAEKRVDHRSKGQL